MWGNLNKTGKKGKVKEEGKKSGSWFGPNAVRGLFDELNEDFCRPALRLTGAKLSPISWRSRAQQQV